MGNMNYYRSGGGRRWRRLKGFRMNSGRFSVQRLRIRFVDFVRILIRWKSLYSRTMEALKKGMCSPGNTSHRNTSRRGLVPKGGYASRPEYKLRSYGRSNSFYAEAIADCLEFIKRSSIQVDDSAPINGR